MRKYNKDESLKDVVCNKCGKTCVKGKRLKDSVEGYIYGVGIEYNTGYWSDCLSDGTIFNLDICESCLSKLMLSCKIKPNYIDTLSIPCVVRQATITDLKPSKGSIKKRK